METRQKKTLEALQTSIQMEIDGKAFYLKASHESNNIAGKKLLARLSDEEDTHRQKFEKIYIGLQDKNAWPATDYQPDGGKRLRTILTEVIESSSTNTGTSITELDAVQTAIDMETKTYDFYSRQTRGATYNAEREFYQALAAEEREHHLILTDYYEYLKDPAAWFVNKEHPSLDGG
ncbi:ferritin family protein [Chloroflexota bacterium]